MCARFIIPVVALVFFALPAVAEVQTESVRAARSVADQTIQLQDRDGDGRISLKESAGAALVLFTSIDTDHSSLINEAEMANAVIRDTKALRITESSDQAAALVAAKFQLMDMDADASISLPEMLAVTEVIFNAADANADGYVSEDELVSLALAQRQPEEAR